MGLMGDCRSVAGRVAEDDGAGSKLPISIRLHLLMCRHCRRYKKQLESMRAAARNLWSKGYDDAAARELKSRILTASSRDSKR